MKRQLIAQHYCAHLSDEVLQCVLYDSEKKDARLIGVEYIVSAKIFESLPADEKKFWHSHNYEVKSGVLTAPGAPEAAEKRPDESPDRHLRQNLAYVAGGSR